MKKSVGEIDAASGVVDRVGSSNVRRIRHWQMKSAESPLKTILSSIHVPINTPTKNYAALEMLVMERTRQLREANRRLEEEIAQKSRAEAKLLSANAELMKIFNAAAGGMRIIDSNFNVVRANTRMAELSSRSIDEMIGSKCYESFSGERCHTDNCTLKRLRSGEKVVNMEDWRSPSGEPPLPCLVNAHVLRDEHGIFVGIVEDFRDLTATKRLQSIAEAVHTMDTIGYVFSGIRHELGNPINALKTTLTVLKRRLNRFSIEEVEEYIERSITDVGRVEFLLRSLRSFSMYERLNIEEVSLDKFMADCERLIAPDAANKNIALSIEVEPSVDCCRADARALQQVILNLVANSIDACDETRDGKISIGIALEGGSVKVVVQDNGRGMSPEQMNDLFQPFHTTKSKGTGLGLVIAKKMMVMMHGAIDVQSRKHIGTKVILTLPASERTACLGNEKNTYNR